MWLLLAFAAHTVRLHMAGGLRPVWWRAGVAAGFRCSQCTSAAIHGWGPTACLVADWANIGGGWGVCVWGGKGVRAAWQMRGPVVPATLLASL